MEEDDTDPLQEITDLYRKRKYDAVPDAFDKVVVEKLHACQMQMWDSFEKEQTCLMSYCDDGMLAEGAKCLPLCEDQANVNDLTVKI